MIIIRMFHKQNYYQLALYLQNISDYIYMYIYSYRLHYENWRFLQFASDKLNDFERDDYIYARHTRFPTRFSYLASCSRSKRESASPSTSCSFTSARFEHRSADCSITRDLLPPSTFRAPYTYRAIRTGMNKGKENTKWYRKKGKRKKDTIDSQK